VSRAVSRSERRTWPFVLLLVVYLLHNDLWIWDDRRLVLGLPVGLLYHLGYCLLASLTLWLLIRHAWPSEVDAADGAGGADGVPGEARSTRS
jgi:hypothetical protein